MSGKPITEAVTYTTHNKHKRSCRHHTMVGLTESNILFYKPMPVSNKEPFTFIHMYTSNGIMVVCKC